MAINYKLLKASVQKVGKFQMFTNIADPQERVMQKNSRRKFIALIASWINRDNELKHYRF